MLDVFLFAKNHWQDIALICTGIVTSASVIVRLTPTPEDDKILAKIVSVLHTLALTPKDRV